MKFRGIAQRIIFSVIPVITVSTLLFIFVIHTVMDAQINQQTGERLRKNLEAARLEIQRELTKNSSIAKSLAIYAETAGRPVKEDGMKEFLLRIIPSNLNTMGGGILYEPYAVYKTRYYFGSYVHTEGERIIYEEDYGQSVDYFSRGWYVNGRQSRGEAVWSDLYYDPAPETAVVAAAVPFFDAGGPVLGVAAAVMSLEDIRQIVRSISVGETGRAFVLGKNGEYISFIDDSRTIKHTIQNDEDPELAALGRKALAVNEGTAAMTRDGIARRAFFITIPETLWTLVILINESEISYSTWGLVSVLAIVPFIGLILAVFCIISAAGHLRKVAKKVNNFADLIASGSFTEQIDITENDEFGVMEHHLNRMAKKMDVMHQNMREMVQAAQEASRAKSDFLSTMSHEIRTPMNAIIGMTVIAKNTGDAVKKEQCLKKIEDASAHLLGIINDILDMSKIEANKLELSPAEFDIEKMIQRVVNVISFRVDEKEQDLAVRIDREIPRFLIGDDQRLAQVITNLLSNAVKFTPEKGKIRLETDLVKKEGRRCTLQFTVADTGIGISKEQQARLFDPFTQADSGVARKFGGTGLGLVISKRIVEMMGGRIWIESEPDKGAVFFFTIEIEAGETEGTVNRASPGPRPLPAAADFPGQGPETEARSPARQGPEVSPGRFEGCRILLAEDVEINREIVLSLLESTGLVFEFAENGAEAVRLYQNSPDRYDLIFMDIHMPEMDGYEAARRIRALEAPGKRVPILAMTANVFREDIEKCLQAGMDDHLGKPLDPEEMINKLRKYLPDKKNGPREPAEQRT